MKYLIDTNVLSELRKGERGNAQVRQWFAAVDDQDVCISVLSLGEIRNGVERLRRRGLCSKGRAEFARLGLGAARLLADGRDTRPWSKNAPTPAAVAGAKEAI